MNALLPPTKEKVQDVTAAILAGGLGTRLRSAVADRPKVLAPVHDRPYLTYLLDQLADASVREVVLLTGYHADQVHAALGDRYLGMRLIHSPEPFPLGTAGSVRRALPHLTSRHVLLLNGDSYCDMDLAGLCAFHQEKAADVSLVLTPVEDAARYGKVELAPGGRVVGFGEKNAAGPGWVNAGIYALERRLIETIPEGRAVSLEREMFPTWLAQGLQVTAYPCSDPFLDIGTRAAYEAAPAFFWPFRMRSMSASERNGV
jgi:NDP-sugar pyrophosphorylase family protein